MTCAYLIGEVRISYKVGWSLMMLNVKWIIKDFQEFELDETIVEGVTVLQQKFINTVTALYLYIIKFRSIFKNLLYYKRSSHNCPSMFPCFDYEDQSQYLTENLLIGKQFRPPFVL